jgi:hypothetical protein
VFNLYRLRWQIELAFKDWKAYSSLRALQSENPAIVEGLIWAAPCAAFLKRALAHWAQLVHRRAISTRISAQSGPHILPMMVDWVAHQTLATKLARVFQYLAENAPRAHPELDKKRPQDALGFVFCPLLKVRPTREIYLLGVRRRARSGGAGVYVENPVCWERQGARTRGARGCARS